MEVFNRPVAIIYCFLIILVTADFIINLILAVFCESFKKEQANLDKEKLLEIEREELIREQLEEEERKEREQM